jgi:hypothetical protein
VIDEQPEVIEGDAEEMPNATEIAAREAHDEAMFRERATSAVAASIPSTELEVRPPSSEVLTPLDPEQVVAAMDAYQALLPKLLKPEDWQKAGRDEFVKKSGWRKIARAFNLSVFKISSGIERDKDGVPLRASAVYRAMAPNGQIQDGDGYCSAGESRFSTNKAKLEHDMAATATTRAKNRAISDLVGMGEVSAEEVVEGQNAPQFPLATKEQQGELRAALEYLFPPDQARMGWEAIKGVFGGVLYGPAVEAVCAVIEAHKGNVDIERTEAQEALNAERDASDG